MQKNMNSSPPRLPRLGGHRSSPARKPIPLPTTPSGPMSRSPSARIEPARSSNSPERPYIDVGYDDDDVDVTPHAPHQVHLASLRSATTPAAPMRQARSPLPRPGRPSSSSSTSASQSWREQVKSEVLGEAPTSPTLPASNASAAVAVTARPETADARHDDISSDTVGVEVTEEVTMPSSADRIERVVRSTFPSMPQVLSSAVLVSDAARSPVIPITGVPNSPASVASSLATDTPRSILRHPGRERNAPSSRAGRRRISFVDLSPLRDSSHSSSPDRAHRHRRESLGGEKDDDDDDGYDFAEPLLRYETDTPPTSTRNAAPDEFFGGGSGGGNGHTLPSPVRSPERHTTTSAAAGAAALVDPASTEHSPDVRPDDRYTQRSSSSSPERPLKAGRSPTRSPPRDVEVVRPQRAARATTAVTVSAPPPPEDENDIITLDTVTPLQVQQQQQQQRERSSRASSAAVVNAADSATTAASQPPPSNVAYNGGQRNKNSPARSASNGRDEDVLTQPHNHSHHPSGRSADATTLATAAVPRVALRPPTRQRWPSDAYVDEPPTEVSTTQRAARSGGRRESLDPEDDMGSSDSGRESGDTSRDSYSSDDGSSLHYEFPVKEAPAVRRTSRERSAEDADAKYVRTPSPKAASPSRTPHREEDSTRDRTKTPSQSLSRSSSGRLPERRPCKSTSGSRAGSVVSGTHRNSTAHSDRSSSNSYRERPIPSTPPSLTEGLDSGMLLHRHSPSREEHLQSSSHDSTLLPSPANNSQAIKREMAATAAASVSREESNSGSHGRSPSTITSRSSGQSVGEDLAPPATPASQPTRAPDIRAPSAFAQAAKQTSPEKSPARHSEQEGRVHRRKHRLREEIAEDVPLAAHSRRSARSSPQKEAKPSLREVTASAPGVAVTAPSLKETARKPKRMEKREEPQVYVDPLLRERQQLHDVAYQQFPTHLSRRAPSNENVLPRQRDTDGAVGMPRSHKRHLSRHSLPEKPGAHHGTGRTVSLRDVMTLHDSPEKKTRQSTASSTASSRAASALPSGGDPHVEREERRRPTARQILREPRTADKDKQTRRQTASTTAGSPEASNGKEEATPESSQLSSDGVPAEDLVWDAATPTSRASSPSPRASPVSTASSAAALTTTSGGGHRVFRKKLVTVVRRRKSGTIPSEDDPVVQMSMVPYREGSPAVLYAEEQQKALRREKLPQKAGSGRAKKGSRVGNGSAIGAVSVPNGAGAPPLERLIDHVQPGRKSSASSRRSSSGTHFRGELVGEKDAGNEGRTVITDEDRLQFRRALSAASSRSASRLSSVARLTPSRRPRSDSVPSTTQPPLLHSAEMQLKQQQKQQSSDAGGACEDADEQRGTIEASPHRHHSRSSSTHSSEHVPAAKERVSASSSAVSLPHGTAKFTSNTAAASATKMCEAVDPKASRRDESTMTRIRHSLIHRHHHHTHRSVSRRSSAQGEPNHGEHTTHVQSADAAPNRASREAGTLSEKPPHTSSAAPQPQTLPDAPYRPTQNDEFYYGADLAKEAVQLQLRDASQRIGITPVAMKLLPRLTLEADKDGNERCGSADPLGVTAWSDSDSGEERRGADADRVAGAPGISRPQRLLQASATQTDCFGPMSIAGGGGEGMGGMPVAAGTPVVRPSLIIGDAATTAAPAPAMGFASAAPSAAAGAEATSLPPADGDTESPGSFVKRTNAPTAAKGPARRVAAPPMVRAPSGSAAALFQVTNSIQPQATVSSAFGHPSPFFASNPSQAAAPLFSQPPMVTGGALLSSAAVPNGVPLFVPQLTVDNVSHLTQDWQSTLRERSGKAKQRAMEQFLLASAEAGAASTLSASHTQHLPAAGAMHARGNLAHGAAAVPASGYGNTTMGGGVAAAYATSEWEQLCRWPVQQQPGLPANEYYGQSPQQQQAAAAVTSVPLAAQTSPPRLLPQTFWDAEREVREKEARVAAVAPRKKASAVSKPSASGAKPPKVTGAAKSATATTSTEKQQSRSSSASPLMASAFDLVEGSSDAQETARSSSSSNRNSTPEKMDAIESLSQPRSRAARSLTPPTSAALASGQSPLDQQQHHLRRGQRDAAPALSPLVADTSKPKESSAKGKRATEAIRSSRRSAATAAAIATAAEGDRKRTTRAATGFTIVEPAIEVAKSKSKQSVDGGGGQRRRRSSAHTADHGDRGRSAGASSVAASHEGSDDDDDEDRRHHHHQHHKSKSKAKKAKYEDERRAKNCRKEKKEKSHKRASSGERRHYNTSHHRTYSAASTVSSEASSASLLSISEAFKMSHYMPVLDGDSDVDSDMTTSMEYQLSRLLLQRERDVSRALTALQHSQETEAARRQRKAEKKAREKAKAKSDQHRRRHRSRSRDSRGSGDAAKRRSTHLSKEDKAKEKKRENEQQQQQQKNEKHRSLSTTLKAKSETDNKRKHGSKHRRSKSASKYEPLPLPSPPPPRQRDAWAEDVATLSGQAEATFGESRFSSPPYESIGAARYSAATSPFTHRDYPAGAPYHEAADFTGEGERGPLPSSGRSYFRSRSNWLNNDDNYRGSSADTHASRYSAASPYSSDYPDVNNRAAATSRYLRRDQYTPLPTSRWADTPRRSFDDDTNSPASASVYESRYRAHNRATRPSTHWADYVREAERNNRASPRAESDELTSPQRATSSRYDFPWAASAHYTSFGQRRRKSNVGDTANPRSEAESYAPRASASTASRYQPSYTSRVGDYDDIDDLPKKNYFNDDSSGAAAPAQPSSWSRPWSSYAARSGEAPTSYSRYAHRRQSPAETDMPPPPPTSSSPYRHRRRRSTTAPATRKDDDILVSTPSQDNDRDGPYDYWEEGANQSTQARRAAPPPPPPPPGDSLNGSARAPSTSDQAFGKGSDDAVKDAAPSAKALPIVMERSVSDAQSAHAFAEGVKEIVQALQQYKERV
jgi:hypothetical protein